MPFSSAALDSLPIIDDLQREEDPLGAPWIPWPGGYPIGAATPAGYSNDGAGYTAAVWSDVLSPGDAGMAVTVPDVDEGIYTEIWLQDDTDPENYVILYAETAGYLGGAELGWEMWATGAGSVKVAGSGPLEAGDRIALTWEESTGTYTGWRKPEGGTWEELLSRELPLVPKQAAISSWEEFRITDFSFGVLEEPRVPPADGPVLVVNSLPDDSITQSHQVVTHIEILQGGEPTGDVLEEVESGSVTMQSGADARSRCSLDVVGLDDLIPVDASSVLNVYRTELAIYKGVKNSEGTYLVPLGVFGIDQSTVSDTGDVSIAVNGRDRAGRFISPEGGFESAGSIPAGTKAGEAIVTTLTNSWPDMPYDAAAFDGLTVPLPALTWEEGEDRWGFAAGIASSCGGELYFDRIGQLTVQPIPDLSQTDPSYLITEGEGGTLLNISRDWDRSRVINRWTVFGQNASNNPSETVPRGVALDNDPASPTYYYGDFGKRLESVNNSFVGTDVQASDMANGLLAKSIGTPDSISFGAIPDPSLSPLDVITVERSRLGISANHIIDTITHPLSSGEVMTAQTRITQALS